MISGETEERMKETFGEWELTPRAELWDKIEQQLPERRRRYLIIWWLLPFVVLLTGSLLILYSGRTNSNETKTKSAHSEMKPSMEKAATKERSSNASAEHEVRYDAVDDDEHTGDHFKKVVSRRGRSDLKLLMSVANATDTESLKTSHDVFRDVVPGKAEVSFSSPESEEMKDSIIIKSAAPGTAKDSAVSDTAGKMKKTEKQKRKAVTELAFSCGRAAVREGHNSANNSFMSSQPILAAGLNTPASIRNKGFEIGIGIVRRKPIGDNFSLLGGAEYSYQSILSGIHNLRLSGGLRASNFRGHPIYAEAALLPVFRMFSRPDDIETRKFGIGASISIGTALKTAKSKSVMIGVLYRQEFTSPLRQPSGTGPLRSMNVQCRLPL